MLENKYKQYVKKNKKQINQIFSLESFCLLFRAYMQAFSMLDLRIRFYAQIHPYGQIAGSRILHPHQSVRSFSLEAKFMVHRVCTLPDLLDKGLHTQIVRSVAQR